MLANKSAHITSSLRCEVLRDYTVYVIVTETRRADLYS